jgi:hypothetical protein
LIGRGYIFNDIGWALAAGRDESIDSIGLLQCFESNQSDMDFGELYSQSADHPGIELPSHIGITMN